MIRDLSETLRAMLTQPGLPAELAASQIVFERPVESFAPAQTTIDLFLYDVRQNLELRSNEPVIQRNNGQALISRPPLRVACTYLVTAWPVGGPDLALQEHRLLSQVLEVLARYPLIPESFLKGSLVGQQPQLPMVTAVADGVKDPVEFWAAIGNKLRSSISTIVTVGFELTPPETAPLAITGELRIGERSAPDEQTLNPATRQEGFRIGGKVSGADNAPVAGATVSLVEAGLVTQTNADGGYHLGLVAAGTYTLRVQAGAAVKTVLVSIPATAGKDYNVRM
jgi:Pvc16 N-terminal domain/Carboxypeptidase regulatory-like domain